MKVIKSRIHCESVKLTTVNDLISLDIKENLSGPELTLEDNSIIILHDCMISTNKELYNAGTKEFNLDILELNASDDAPDNSLYRNEIIAAVYKYTYLDISNSKKTIYRLAF
jgi:hypothetical protein